jgi:hypothetical protein
MSSETRSEAEKFFRTHRGAKFIAPLYKGRAPFDLVSLVTDRLVSEQELDACIALYGGKGVGKSTACLYLAWRIAVRLGKIHNKPWTDFFSIDNVKSVDPSGTMEMFSSDVFTKSSNQVFIIDDIGVTANSRNFATAINKQLNTIFTIARIYRHCIIVNTVWPELVDNVIRSFANYTGVVIGPDMDPESIYYHMNRIKVYEMSKVETPALSGKTRKAYNKFFRFRDKKDKKLYRVVAMRTRKPPQDLQDAYNKIRREMTLEYIRVNAPGYNGEDDDSPSGGSYKYKKPKPPTKSEIQWQKDLTEWYDTVIDMRVKQGMSYNKVRSVTGLANTKIDRMVAMSYQKQGIPPARKEDDEPDR